MRDRLAALAKEIRTKQDLLQSKIRQIRSSDPSSIKPVSKTDISMSVCAIDGGLLAHRMHGADILLCRAVGVSFSYSDSKLAGVSYYPDKGPLPSIFIESSLDEHEAMIFRSLVRLKEELSCAFECLERFSPNALLMDGSLLPLPSDCPPKESELFKLYSIVLDLYKNLHRKCNEKKCILIGVIKDSRSRKFAKEHDLSCSDSVMCNYLLGEFERTVSMPYSEGSDIAVFYIKPARNDLPLRIETTCHETDRVASMICSLSAFSENFAYPAVLIEADMCAALDPKEIEAVEASLSSMSGLKPLRRNTRPFR